MFISLRPDTNWFCLQSFTMCYWFCWHAYWKMTPFEVLTSIWSIFSYYWTNPINPIKRANKVLWKCLIMKAKCVIIELIQFVSLSGSVLIRLKNVLSYSLWDCVAVYIIFCTVLGGKAFQLFLKHFLAVIQFSVKWVYIYTGVNFCSKNVAVLYNSLNSLFTKAKDSQGSSLLFSNERIDFSFWLYGELIWSQKRGHLSIATCRLWALCLSDSWWKSIADYRPKGIIGKHQHEDS